MIDPMHNLFLGSAKHAMELFTKNGILTKPLLQQMQQVMDSFCVPSDCGKIRN